MGFTGAEPEVGILVPETSLVVQWLRTHVPVQGMWVRPMVWGLRSSHTPQRKCFPGSTVGQESACSMQETQEAQVQSLGGDDPLAEKMETHPSILA